MPPTVAQLVGRAVVLYDGECVFCRRSVAVLRWLDGLGRLAFMNARNVDDLPPAHPPLDPKRLLEEMHVVTPTGRVYAGFRAVRWLAWRLPLTMFVAPLLYLPGVLWLGSRAYRWVARNRFDLVPCAAGGCQIGHPGWHRR